MGTKAGINDETVKLYVGGIDTSWTSDKIKDILSQFGKVKRVDIVKNFSFAFVENQGEADKIIRDTNQKVIEGKKLVVQLSKNKQNLPDCDELCFECGKSGHWAKDCSVRLSRMAKSQARDPFGNGGYPSQGLPMHDSGDSYGRDPSRYPPRDRESYPVDLPPSRTYERDFYRTGVIGRETYARDIREPYVRDPYVRDPYVRDPYTRDPYSREAYTRETYSREAYARDPYSREAYSRDPYSRDTYYDRYDSRAYPATYRERSPPPTYRRSPPPARSTLTAEPDPYAAARERLAYGRSYSDAARTAADPYDKRPDVASAPRRSIDPYDLPPRRADPYASAHLNQSYATYDYSNKAASGRLAYDVGTNVAPPSAAPLARDTSGLDKRYAEPVSRPRPDY